MRRERKRSSEGRTKCLLSCSAAERKMIPVDSDCNQKYWSWHQLQREEPSNPFYVLWSGVNSRRFFFKQPPRWRLTNPASTRTKALNFTPSGFSCRRRMLHHSTDTVMKHTCIFSKINSVRLEPKVSVLEQFWESCPHEGAVSITLGTFLISQLNRC